MKDRRRPRIIITRVIVFLLLGAIVNVAVAWGLAYSQVWDTGDVVELSSIDTADMKRHTFPSINSDRCTAIEGFEVAALGRHTRILNLSYYGDALEQALNSSAKYVGGTGEEYHVCRYESSGLPLLAMRGEYFIHEQQQKEITRSAVNGMLLPSDQDCMFHSQILPYAILPVGFAINTIFYAAMLWMLCFAPGSVRRAFRRRRGLCPACAYPAGTSPVCTECGGTVKRSAVSDQRSVTKNQS